MHRYSYTDSIYRLCLRVCVCMCVYIKKSLCISGKTAEENTNKSKKRTNLSAVLCIIIFSLELTMYFDRRDGSCDGRILSWNTRLFN